MRIVIDLAGKFIESLDRVGGAEQRSRVALIREAIAEFLRQESVSPAETAFGLCKGRKTDGAKY